MILHELISYEILRVIWWLLLGVVLIGVAIMDGFDYGVATLLPFAGRDDVERRVVINTIGPVWEGNQVWLILGGGALFAAWPTLYAVTFAGFYLAMFAVLFALILRPVGFKYRSKIDNPFWRGCWDWALFIGGFVPALIFGVAVGNVLLGVPFELAPDMKITYSGTFFGLLNPFAVLCGLLSVAMTVMQGAAWLALKTDGIIALRACRYGTVAAILTVILFAMNGAVLSFLDVSYTIQGTIDPNGPSNPLVKTVAHTAGGANWFTNYSLYPWMLLAPLLGFLGALGALFGIRNRKEWSILLSSVSILGIVSTVGLSMFPFILPSSSQPDASFLVWDGSSSHMTLFIMLIVATIFVPIVLIYTAWVYKVLWGKVDETDVLDESTHAY